MANRDIYPAHAKILWMLCAGKCAICLTPIVMSSQQGKLLVIGEMAHIYGEKKGAARYVDSIEEKFIRSYSNHIALCPRCHTIIDKNNDDYPVEKLFSIKEQHEKWFYDSLKENISDVTFAELEVIVRYLEAQPIDDTSLYLITPKDKIEKNNLSVRIDNLVKLGLIQRGQVANYLNKQPDIEFADRLRAGFVSKYLSLREQQYHGDELFYLLLNFASSQSNDFKIQAAGLAVLTYFFEICDIFEK